MDITYVYSGLQRNYINAMKATKDSKSFINSMKTTKAEY